MGVGDVQKLAVQDFRQIGEIIQSPANLEVDGDNSTYRRCDGRVMNRSSFGFEFNRRFNTPGQFTHTARTLAVTPSGAAIAANTTHFVAGGTASSATAQIQTSTDGITWTSRAGTGTAVTIRNMVWTGTNWVIKDTSTTVPYYSADPTATFSASTGGTTNVACADFGALVYSSSLGQVLFIPNGAGTTVCTSANNGQTWTDRTTPTSFAKGQGVWTGQKYIVTEFVTNSKRIQTSTDGITWVDETTPWALHGTTGRYIVTDGAGTIVALPGAAPSAIDQLELMVSKDHGATWSLITLPFAAGSVLAASDLSFANGIFFYTVANSAFKPHLYSKDGLTWQIPETFQLMTQSPQQFAWKAGVYVGISQNTSALSATEDTSKFYLPRTVRMQNGTGYTTGNLGHQEYIKVK